MWQVPPGNRFVSFMHAMRTVCACQAMLSPSLGRPNENRAPGWGEASALSVALMSSDDSR